MYVVWNPKILIYGFKIGWILQVSSTGVGMIFLGGRSLPPTQELFMPMEEPLAKGVASGTDWWDPTLSGNRWSTWANPEKIYLPSSLPTIFYLPVTKCEPVYT